MAEQNDKKVVENIKSQYVEEHKPTDLENLKKLDKKVKQPALIFAYTFGIIGALILGVGMCLAMKVIGGTTPLMILGIIVGLVGIVMVSINYVLYSKIIEKRKAKYRNEILELSDNILNK